MVCMVEYGRMAAMVRLLKVGKFPTTAEEATNEKIAALNLYNQFHHADEANLLEEEDMHVFDCRPLTDPLHLVCCNACKKPVKASQYAAHSERCGSLNPASDIGQELGCVSGHKKPPRKGRKLSQATNGVILEEQEKLESDVGHSESNFDNQSSMLAAQSTEVQKITLSVGHAAATDASVTGPGDAPVPLASKIYYSQGNHRLRLQLGYLYNTSCATGATDSLSSEAMQGKERRI